MMIYKFSPWLLPLFASMSIQLLLAGYAFRKRKDALARTFYWLMVSMLIWTVCYTLGLASETLAGKIFWLRLKYLGSISTPIIWLVFSLQFTQNEAFLTRRTKATLWGFYIVTLIVVFSSNWQKWMWESIWIEPGLIEEQVIHGWYFWLYAIISYLFIISSAWFYIRFLWLVPALYRKQAILMAAGSAIPLLGRIALDFFGLDLVPQLDEVITFFLASSVIFGFALFRYAALSIIPIAYAQVFHSMEIGAIVLDPSIRVIEINQTARQMLQIKSSNIAGQPLQTFLPQVNRSLLESHTVVDLALKVNNEDAYYEVRTSDIHGRQKQVLGYLLMIANITQRKKDSFALESLARQDDLTDLLNRRTFMNLAKIEHQRSIRYGHTYAVILFDVDNFKHINDSYGHPFGDHTLREIANRLKEHLRATDLVARYGGDEFIIQIPETDKKSAFLIAEKIRHGISTMPIQPEEMNNPSLATISMGVALFTPDNENEQDEFDAVLKKADEMLYVAKRAGRNRLAG